jgi:hypothetical protein
MPKEWTKREMTPWLDAADWVAANVFAGLDTRIARRLRAVNLHFIDVAVPHVYALTDPAGEGVGICPLARRLGPLQTRETLVHEFCHLLVIFSGGTGRHSKPWKTAMLAAADACDEVGERRLADMIRRDVGLYVKREVTDLEVRKQLRFVMLHLADRRFSNVAGWLADWAGWEVRPFTKRFGWLKSEWEMLRLGRVN